MPTGIRAHHIDYSISFPVGLYANGYKGINNAKQGQCSEIFADSFFFLQNNWHDIRSYIITNTYDIKREVANIESSPISDTSRINTAY